MTDVRCVRRSRVFRTDTLVHLVEVPDNDATMAGKVRYVCTRRWVWPWQVAWENDHFPTCLQCIGAVPYC